MRTSPKFSFKGYDLNIALYNNRETIKTITALFGTINILTTNWKIFGVTLVSALIALAVKVGIDAVDYYFSDVAI